MSSNCLQQDLQKENIAFRVFKGRTNFLLLILLKPFSQFSGQVNPKFIIVELDFSVNFNVNILTGKMPKIAWVCDIKSEIKISNLDWAQIIKMDYAQNLRKYPISACIVAYFIIYY